MSCLLQFASTCHDLHTTIIHIARNVLKHCISNIVYTTRGQNKNIAPSELTNWLTSCYSPKKPQTQRSPSRTADGFGYYWLCLFICQTTFFSTLGSARSPMPLCCTHCFTRCNFLFHFRNFLLVGALFLQCPSGSRRWCLGWRMCVFFCCCCCFCSLFLPFGRKILVFACKSRTVRIVTGTAGNGRKIPLRKVQDLSV